jgi:hypothetical protein
MNRVDLELTDRVCDGGDAIDDGRAAVDNDDGGSVEVDEASGKTRCRYFHRFVANRDAEHSASADELVE